MAPLTRQAISRTSPSWGRGAERRRAFRAGWLAWLAAWPLWAQPSVQVWVSSSDQRQQLSERPPLEFTTRVPKGETVIQVEPQQTFQTMLGMGASLESATCYNLAQLAPADRDRVIDSLVNPTNGIGINLMRICIGTPDFTGEPWYSYCDLPPGRTDPGLQEFSIAKDCEYILPALKLARQRNPELLFFATPWSPPGWMKSTGSLIGGSLLPEYYAAYAQYLVKFLQAYAAEGIPVHALTVQNEPGVDRAREKNPKWFYPSCRWTAEEERDFIRDRLRPALTNAGLATRIWCYDHNYNERASREGDDPGIDYPRTILSDPKAAAAVDGVAFHGYSGEPAGMTVLHQEFPDKPIYFTEGSVFGTQGALELIARLRNWASSYNAWVTMLDDRGLPNNGPFAASRTMITLDSQERSATYRFDYWMYGQFMKFIARGAQRIHSSGSARSFGNVAFRNPDGSLVLVVANAMPREQKFSVVWQNRSFMAQLGPRSLATYRWPGQ